MNVSSAACRLRRLMRTAAAPAALLLLLPSGAGAGWFGDTFIDPADGHFDISSWMAEKRGAMLVPVVITEPAIGYGAGGVLVWFHGQRAGAAQTGGSPFDPPPPGPEGRRSPPSMSGGAGGGTENGTWFGGVFHFGVWRDDRIRYLGAVARTSLNLGFYGLDGGEATEGLRLEYNLLGTLVYQEIKFRIAGSGFMAGAQGVYLDAESKFETDQAPPGVPELSSTTRAVGLGLMLTYERLDNLFTPGRGLAADLGAIWYDEAIGSDCEFGRLSAGARFYYDVRERLVLGLRLKGAAVSDGAPFYMYPFVRIRGVEAMRYQGERVVDAEGEVRWGFTPRWSLMGFGGAGYAASTGEESEGESTVTALGTGIRYLISRRFGAHMGVDIAWGPETTALYIVFGNYWVR